MKTIIVVIWGLLFILPTTAQQDTPPGAQKSQRVTSGASQTNRPSDAQTAPNPTRPTPDAEQENIRELTHRIQKLELETIQKSGQTTKITIITASIAAAAILGAALLGICGQYFMARREDRRAIAAAQQAAEQARQEAVFRHTEQILEFRLKQMEQFYAPMFALLGQSKGLYEKMLDQLAQDDPQRYRLPPEPDPQDHRLQVRNKDGEWKGFRLLDQLPAVKTNPKAFALADRILQIGEQMTKIISEHAGLASEDLIGLLGQYMAHYAILSTIHKLGETEAYEPEWHKRGYYPRQLDGKIEEGYRELTHFLAEYVNASKRMLEALPAAQRTQQS